jgi:hypothetical protein
MANPKFIIVFGTTDFISVQNMGTVAVHDVATARDLAFKFSQVIPDDIDDLHDRITAWDGVSRLRIIHSDDDNFYFDCIPIENTSSDTCRFDSFVNAYKVEDRDEDEVE